MPVVRAGPGRGHLDAVVVVEQQRICDLVVLGQLLHGAERHLRTRAARLDVAQQRGEGDRQPDRGQQQEQRERDRAGRCGARSARLRRAIASAGLRRWARPERTVGTRARSAVGARGPRRRCPLRAGAARTGRGSLSCARFGVGSSRVPAERECGLPRSTRRRPAARAHQSSATVSRYRGERGAPSSTSASLTCPVLKSNGVHKNNTSFIPARRRCSQNINTGVRSRRACVHKMLTWRIASVDRRVNSRQMPTFTNWTHQAFLERQSSRGVTATAHTASIHQLELFPAPRRRPRSQPRQTTKGASTVRVNRTLILFAIVALVLVVPASASARRLIIGGSTSVLPLAQKLATAYHKAFPRIPAPKVERRAVRHRHQRRGRQAASTSATPRATRSKASIPTGSCSRRSPATACA